MEDKEIPILCLDVIFKSVFSDLESILKYFIYDITGLKFNKIILGMNELPINKKNEKYKKCDFIIHTDKNVIINIELNDTYYQSMLIKNTSYVFSLFSRYTSKGDEYLENLKVIQININNFSRFNKPIIDYRIMNNSYGYIYLNNISIYDLDIIRSKKLYDNKLTRIRRYIRWGRLFACTSIEEMEPILDELLTKKEVYLFMEKVKKITRYYHVMDEAEALREDDKIRRSLRREGERIGFSNGERIGFSNGEKVGFSNGFTDGIMSMIKNMYQNHMDIETIAKVSNKSIEEIDKIIKVG